MFHQYDEGRVRELMPKETTSLFVVDQAASYTISYYNYIICYYSMVYPFLRELMPEETSSLFVVDQAVDCIGLEVFFYMRARAVPAAGRNRTLSGTLASRNVT